MLSVMIFLCSTAVSSSNCDAHTAINVMHGPETGSPVTCALMGQAIAARDTLKPHDDEYVKITCTPRKVAED